MPTSRYIWWKRVTTKIYSKATVVFIHFLITKMKGLEMVKCESLRINMFRITHTRKSVNFPVTNVTITGLYLLPCKVIEMKKWNVWAGYFPLASFPFDANNRRTNIDVNGGYCLITGRWFCTSWRKAANEITRKLMTGL